MDTPSRKSTEEQELPHSGHLGLENPPARTFDKTPLPVAFEEHLTDDKGNIIVPEPHKALNTAEQEIIPTPLVAEKEKTPTSRGRRALIAAGATFAGLAVAGGAVFGISQANQPPKTDPIATAPADPSEGNENPGTPVVEEEKTFEQLVNENKIKAGLSAEEYAAELDDRLTKWALAGTNEETLRGWLDADDVVAFEDDLAAQNTALFTNAILKPGFHEVPSLANIEANFTTRNAAWSALWFRSNGTLELDTTIQEVKTVSEDLEDNTRVIYFAGYDTNNAEEAGFVNEETRQKAMDKVGETWDQTLTLVTIDGYEYVANWED